MNDSRNLADEFEKIVSSMHIKLKPTDYEFMKATLRDDYKLDFSDELFEEYVILFFLSYYDVILSSLTTLVKAHEKEIVKDNRTTYRVIKAIKKGDYSKIQFLTVVKYFQELGYGKNHTPFDKESKT